MTIRKGKITRRNHRIHVHHIDRSLHDGHGDDHDDGGDGLTNHS